VQQQCTRVVTTNCEHERGGEERSRSPEKSPRGLDYSPRCLTSQSSVANLEIMHAECSLWTMESVVQSVSELSDDSHKA
jgi:hypothetical protein